LLVQAAKEKLLCDGSGPPQSARTLQPLGEGMPQQAGIVLEVGTVRKKQAAVFQRVLRSL
jgi:hypothetical protein